MLFLLVTSAWALLASESFSHKDWQVVCDNTNRCKMAGYTEYTTDGVYFPISILFDREAGANTDVHGYIQIGDPEGSENTISTNATLKMYINNKIYTIKNSEKLPPNQTYEFLDALVKEKKIEFIYDDTYKWIFSQKGSFATMLKMDAYQKRVDTIGAIYKKGSKKERAVLQSKPIPTIIAPKVYSTSARSIPPKVLLSSKNKKLLQHLLSAYYSGGENSECGEALEQANKTLKIFRINDKFSIASQSCYMGAYNYSDAYWLINAKPPFEPRYLFNATDLYINEDGTLRIGTSQKGRGLGDCWSQSESVWNGTEFIWISKTTTGLCRGFAGGAWELPIFVTNVKTQSSFK